MILTMRFFFKTTAIKRKTKTQIKKLHEKIAKLYNFYINFDKFPPRNLRTGRPSSEVIERRYRI